MLEALAHLNYGCTSFLITHDLRLAVNADRILYLDAGRLAESGTHQELLRANGLYAQAFRMQSSSPALEPEAGIPALAGAGS